MKEMLYKAERKIEILDKGEFLDLSYWILSLGTHPTAYIKLPNDSKYFGKVYDDIQIDVHGGLTYSRDHLWTGEGEKEINGWFIGWDYAHYGDYMGYEEMLPANIRTCGKKWTTQEIKEEVFDAIKQIVE